MTLNAYYTLMAAVLVLGLGHWLVSRIAFLREFNIPEPVAGGLVAALALWGAQSGLDTKLSFDADLQRGFMLAFFASIGLSADFAHLRAGGRPLVIFMFTVAGLVLVQDLVGVGMASALGLDPLLGLVAGSVTLVGGHGTAGAWGDVFEKEYGLAGAMSLGMACATFGLVLGGIVGGPVAKRLIARGAKPSAAVAAQAAQAQPANAEPQPIDVFEYPKAVRLITASSGMTTLAMFAFCLAFSDFMVRVAKGTPLQMPQFVWALAGGVLLRNTLTGLFRVNMFDRAIDVFGNISLSLFLAMALMSLKLWELAGMAGPVLVILLVQVAVVALYSALVTFRAMGSDYDAAVLCAGQCGFGLGATPTAVANMQAITNRFGPSHKAFLLVPMVGAFFVDLINAGVIKLFVDLLR